MTTAPDNSGKAKHTLVPPVPYKPPPKEGEELPEEEEEYEDGEEDAEHVNGQVEEDESDEDEEEEEEEEVIPFILCQWGCTDLRVGTRAGSALRRCSRFFSVQSPFLVLSTHTGPGRGRG
ncbi:hypothetical protein CALCODRAFT_69873 [Calocera cornea HHB12733]|uniref:Uncharacterized protein n=1 Tax=Calocera cornea HHB12733 TaxID=1353952 RepID=A0A165DIW6_9BASI|nr:hypothetical protein CALCODRAFT_69873 [Calocera cornea HHB12733]